MFTRVSIMGVCVLLHVFVCLLARAATTATTTMSYTRNYISSEVTEFSFYESSLFTLSLFTLSLSLSLPLCMHTLVPLCYIQSMDRELSVVVSGNNNKKCLGRLLLLLLLLKNFASEKSIKVPFNGILYKHRFIKYKLMHQLILISMFQYVSVALLHRIQFKMMTKRQKQSLKTIKSVPGKHAISPSISHSPWGLAFIDHSKVISTQLLLTCIITVYCYKCLSSFELTSIL